MLSSEIAATNRPPTNENNTSTSTSARSKDDEVVAYLFQRPEVEHQFSGKRWANDSVLDQVKKFSNCHGNNSIRQSSSLFFAGMQYFE